MNPHKRDAPSTLEPATIASSGQIQSLRSLTALPLEIRAAWVRRFLPSRLLDYFHIDRQTFKNPQGEIVVQHIGLPTGEIRLAIWRTLSDRDPVAMAEAADTASNQIELRFLTTNDPTAPRFDIDQDATGAPTRLGTAQRNIPAEVAAMAAGLAPNQVRRGLGLVAQDILPQFEAFLTAIGHDLVLAVPLAYHNAILMEGWGFDYLYGRKVMEEIDRRFQPNGDLRQRLDGSTPFRQPHQADTVRGRSWAIHDGILEEPIDSIKMIKRVGHQAGVHTFNGPH